MRTELTREQALMWLSGLKGQEVAVAVRVESDYSADVVNVTGTLTHATDSDEAAAILGLDRERHREDMAAHYHVGDSGALNLSDPDLPCKFERHQMNEPAREHPGDPASYAGWLVITLAENIVTDGTTEIDGETFAVEVARNPVTIEVHPQGKGEA